MKTNPKLFFIAIAICLFTVSASIDDVDALNRKVAITNMTVEPPAIVDSDMNLLKGVELMAKNDAGKEAVNAEVYNEFQQGLKHYRRHTPEEWVRAVASLKTTIDMDPQYGKSYALLARIYEKASVEFLFGLAATSPWAAALRVSYEEASDLAQKYFKLAKDNPTSLYYWVASKSSLKDRQHTVAITEASQALALDPNNPDILLQMAETLVFAGRPEEALGYLDKAIRENPHYENPDCPWVSGMAHFAIGNLKEAASCFEKAHTLNPEERWYTLSLAATYAQLGRRQQAHDTIEWTTEWLKRPNVVGTVMIYLPFKDTEVANRFAEGLRRAGLK